MGRKIGGLGLVNYKDHPKDNRYKIFNFNTKVEADFFEDLLNKDKIEFEKDEEELDSLSTLHFTVRHEVEKKGVMYLYAVGQRDLKKVHNMNYMVNAKFRQNMIQSPILRYGLVIFFLALLSFAIFGYIKVNYL
jgi:hypothetical protein